MMTDGDRKSSVVDMDSPRQISAADRPIALPVEENEVDTENDFEFEFEFASKFPTAGEDVTANEILYPVFGRDFNHIELASLPMEKLVLEGDSAASSESDEPAPETYCAWSPRSPEKYQKRSSSTGSTAAGQCQWRLRDILTVGRSRSDGKERFLFVRANDGDDQAHRKEIRTDSKADSTVKMPAKGLLAAHKAFYGNSKGEKGRRSFLPYRPELVGIAVGRTRRLF